MSKGEKLICMFIFLTYAFLMLILWQIGNQIDALTPQKQMVERIATEVRLCCWYYDIIQDDIRHPKQETWTKEGREMLLKWVREEFSAPTELLPNEVQTWVEEVRK